jgi:hypothetical protein
MKVPTVSIYNIIGIESIERMFNATMQKTLKVFCIEEDFLVAMK